MFVSYLRTLWLLQSLEDMSFFFPESFVDLHCTGFWIYSADKAARIPVGFGKVV